MEPGIAELNSLAEKILAAETSSTDLPETLEQYLVNFTAWLERFKAGSIEVTENELLDLNEKHAAVLAKAEGALKGTIDNLKGLRQKGKGLKMYIDVLPKTISRTRPRKG